MPQNAQVSLKKREVEFWKFYVGFLIDRFLIAIIPKVRNKNMPNIDMKPLIFTKRLNFIETQFHNRSSIFLLSSIRILKYVVILSLITFGAACISNKNVIIVSFIVEIKKIK